MSSRYSSRARDRQNLFGTALSPSPQPQSQTPPTAYERVEYSQSAQELASLEAQAEETMGVMSDKIKTLKELSLAMGGEINKSKDTLLYLSQDMGLTSEKIKLNMERMKLFANKSGVSWKIWLLFLFLVGWFFFYTWVF